MNKSLFQLSAEYQQIMDKIDQIDEITPELMDELNAIHEPTENKILAKTSIVKSFEAEAKSIDEAVKQMIKRHDSLMKKANDIRADIKETMEACKIEKAKNPFHDVRIMLNNPKLSDDLEENLLPSNYFKEKMSRSIDRITLLRDLKDALDIPGARIVRETRLQIR